MAIWKARPVALLQSYCQCDRAVAGSIYPPLDHASMPKLETWSCTLDVRASMAYPVGIDDRCSARCNTVAYQIAEALSFAFYCHRFFQRTTSLFCIPRYGMGLSLYLAVVDNIDRLQWTQGCTDHPTQQGLFEDVLHHHQRIPAYGLPACMRGPQSHLFLARA